MIVEAVVAAVVTVLVWIMGLLPMLPPGLGLDNPVVGPALVLANAFLPLSEAVTFIAWLTQVAGTMLGAWGVWAVLKIVRGM